MRHRSEFHYEQEVCRQKLIGFFPTVSLIAARTASWSAE
jgi:hypothetical protein